MYQDFAVEVEGALNGKLLSTDKHLSMPFYVSIYDVEGALIEVMHKLKSPPKNVDQVYAIRKHTN